jgi:lipoate-protein ligase B
MSALPGKGSAPMATCHVVRIERIGYADGLALQHRILERLKATMSPDAALVLLEHDPVITIGRSGTEDHLRVSRAELARRGIELHESRRGGDITYHGPGQIVGYPIVHLAEDRRDVHRYLRSVEAVLMGALARFGIAGRRVAGYTGVWVGDAKVAAIGVAFSRWTAHHGFALNVTTDLSAFGLIVPCGIDDKPVTSMAHILGASPRRTDVEDVLIAAFAAEFGFDEVSECASVDELPATLR